jgi:ferredoxin-NADP reductase
MTYANIVTDSGNRFYSTLGNLKVNPLVGIVIPDFDTGDALYLTGSTSLLFGEEASSVLARTQVAVKITVSDAKFIRQCLPFRGPLVDHSPYNPPVRYLTSERAPNTAPVSSSSSISATLINKEPITPTVNRFTFRLSSKPKWVAGQHVTFDFHDEVSGGYSHMNDSDPQSLNDDYIRTFTVSSRPEEENLQITVRRNGPVTGFLWRQNVNAQLEIPVMGFGGKEEFHLPVPASPSSEDGKATGPSSVFVAGGVGITPILAQAGPIVASGGSSLAVLWTLKREDANFAIDSFERIPGLASATRLFLTGKDNSSPTVAAQIEKLKSMGSHVTERRIGEDDLEPFKREGVRYYICAAPVLMRQVNAWLEGLDVVTEDFGY